MVIPCYNEAKRLDLCSLDALADACWILFVNAGSTDNTQQVLSRHLNEKRFLLTLHENVGKGEAVRQGMLHLKTLRCFEDIEWVGYWDADFAASVSQVTYMLRYAALQDPAVDAVLGSRIERMGSAIRRRRTRRVLGRVFAAASKLVLGLTCYDSQCGAKLFRKEVLDVAFGQPFISRWVFDVEILLRLRGRNIIECPLMEWHDVPGSKMRICRVAVRTLIDLMRIRKRYLAGEVTAKRHTCGLSR